MRIVFACACAALFSATTCFGGEEIEIARGAGANTPRQPQLAIDESGAIHLVYGMGDRVLYVRSEDSGKSFSEPIELPTGGLVMSLGMRRGPRIAVAGETICVAAIGGKEGKGRDGDVLAWRSSDGGRSWSESVRINSVAGSAREGLHALAAGPRGELGCVWLDLRSGKTEVYASTSADGGASWSENALVYRSPDGSVCECCHPSVAYDSTGRLFVLWRNSLGGARDMYVAVSDDGKRFDNAKKVGQGTWPLEACPMDGGSLALTSDGKLATVWRRDKTVFLASPDSPLERALGEGEQPVIAKSGGDLHIAWLGGRSGALYLQAPAKADTPTRLADRASDPAIAASPGADGFVAIAYERLEGDERAICLRAIGGRR